MKLLIAAILLAAGSAGAAAQHPPAVLDAHRTFTEQDFARLRFLEGRWSGRAPDGSTFYEAYEFTGPRTLRAQRYTDATFATRGDSSQVTFEGGAILSRWGDYSWRAVEIGDDHAVFAPVNAPSRFTWRRNGPDRVDVVQSWTDAGGARQSYTVPLTRIAD